MAQGPSDTILVAIRIMLRIRESKVRNPDPPLSISSLSTSICHMSLHCECMVAVKKCKYFFQKRFSSSWEQQTPIPRKRQRFTDAKVSSKVIMQFIKQIHLYSNF